MTSKCIHMFDYCRQNGKIITANKFEELKEKVRSKYGVESQSFKIVLEDGCELEEEDAFQILKDDCNLYLLVEDQTLNFPSTSSGALQSSSSASSSPSENLINLVKTLRKQKSGQTQKNQTKKRRTTVKIHLGWLSYENDRYAQIKLKTGGGSRSVELLCDASYSDILERAKELFFPNGESSKGNWETFHKALGDFKQNIIDERDFSLTNYISKNCLTTKSRIYLMTKRITMVNPYNLPDLEDYGFSDSEDQLPVVISSSSSPASNLAEERPIVISNSSSEELPDLDDDITEPCPRTFTPGSNETFPSTPTLNHTAIFTSGSNEAVSGTPILNHMATFTPGSNETLPWTPSLNHTATFTPGSNEAVPGTPSLNHTATSTPGSNETLPWTPSLNHTATFTPGSNDHESYVQSPMVRIRMPTIPSCVICKDRYCDSFLDCGHTLCYICAVELQERGSECHLCRNIFHKINKLFY